VVLVVDDDVGIRRLVRTGLELEGYAVIEAATMAQARALLDQAIDGVVLDRQLPDGNGADLIGELSHRQPRARVIVHSELGGLDGQASAAKGDLSAILALLDPEARQVALSEPTDLALHLANDLRLAWFELCLWDPELPPDSRPHVADAVLAAVAAALARPQPLGWGLDPALAPVAEAFALNSSTVDGAVAQLVCLREAYERTVLASLPETQQAEAGRRLNMIVHRMMTVVVRAGVKQLEAHAFTDPLTGLGNRRAFDMDLRRECARAARHDRPLTIAIIDLDGLKAINDRSGHAAGDRALRALATTLTASLRREDAAYRIGGDEFAVVLPDAAAMGAGFLADRLQLAGGPSASVGVATYPTDILERLVELADARLYATRRSNRVVEPVDHEWPASSEPG
jgi:diguanylate cyclase (GGDEF)-like protein